jgi:hypothetical protein
MVIPKNLKQFYLQSTVKIK